MRGPWPVLGRWVGLGVTWVGIGRTEGVSPTFSFPEAACVVQCTELKREDTPSRFGRLGVSSVHQYAFFIAWQAYHDTVESVKQEKTQLIARCIILGEIRKAARFFVLTGQNRGRLFFLDFGIRGSGWMRKHQLNGVGV